jgi:hypothetical protein
MSLNFQVLEPVLVKDPRIIIDNKRDYAVLESGTRFTNKQWTSTSVSSASINFQCPPPNKDIIMDRRVSITLPMRAIFKGTVPPGCQLLKKEGFAPRAFPIASQIDTLNININNASVTQQMGEIIHALLRFNNSDSLLEYDYSETPSYLDCSQNYNDLYMSNRNPLASATNGLGAIPTRGAFSQFNVVYNPENDTGVAREQYAIVDMVATEVLFLSPYYWGSLQQNHSGFLNVTSNDYTFNFLPQAANRAFSHNPLAPNSAPIDDNASIMYYDNLGSRTYPGGANYPFSFGNQSQVILNVNYITPKDNLYIGPHTPISYPFFRVVKYNKDFGAIVKGAASPLTTDTIVCSSIPRRIYFYARVKNSVYYSNPSITDSYYGIDNVSLQFINNDGLLSGSTKNQLYQMARKNHCNINWSDFSGVPIYKSSGTNFGTGTGKTDPANADLIYGGVGPIHCYEFATDIGLENGYAPGVGNSSYNFQITATIRNINTTTAFDNFEVSLYMLVVSEGVFNVTESGAAQTNLSVLSQMDVLDAKTRHWIDYNDVQEVNGGNFMSGLKNFGSKLSQANKFLKNKKIISRGADALSYIPGPQQDVLKGVSDVSRALGYGQRKTKSKGGVVIGAGKMSRTTLKSRARRS